MKYDFHAQARSSRGSYMTNSSDPYWSVSETQALSHWYGFWCVISQKSPWPKREDSPEGQLMASGLHTTLLKTLSVPPHTSGLPSVSNNLAQTLPHNKRHDGDGRGTLC